MEAPAAGMVPCGSTFAASTLGTLVFGLMFPVAVLATDSGNAQEITTRNAASDNQELVEPQYRKALILARNGEHQQALAMLAPLVRDPMRFPSITADYLVILTWNNQKGRAIKLYEQLPEVFERPSYLVRDMAEAYMDEKLFDGAVACFESLLARDPRDEASQAGLVKSMFLSGKASRAQARLDQLIVRAPASLELRLLRPWMLEQQGEIWQAVLEYEAISRKWPDQTVSARRALLAMSRMGASSYALEQALIHHPQDTDLRDEIAGDMAVDSLNWNEPEIALANLRGRLEDGNLRAQYDEVVALAAANRHAEATHAYAALIDADATPPGWVTQPAADAYLELQQPERAIELYDQVLTSEKESYSARMGKAYALMDIGRIRQARFILDELDDENSWTYGSGHAVKANDPKAEIAVAKGWLLSDEGALQEADNHFRHLHELAPANSEFRTGLAQTYLYRGWPRKAIREFQILATLNPGYLAADIGSITARNTLAMKQRARTQAGALFSRHPNDPRVRRLMRELEVDSMRLLDFRVDGENDNDGAGDLSIRLGYRHPATLKTQITGFVLHRKSAQLGDAATFDRAGIGVEHTFDSTWHAGETLSWDFGNGGEPGSRTTLNVTPDDYWRIDLAYDSLATDVALRARVAGINSSRAEMIVIYRESDWREYSLGLSYSHFSDSNKRNEAFVRCEQGLWARENVMMRLLLDAYATTNSLDSTAYFNPGSDWSTSATHVTRHTFYRRYDRRYTQSLRLTAGGYWQSGFSGKVLGAIAYEQSYEFTDTQSLEWSIGFSSRPYDGVNVASRSYHLAYLGRF